jgi:tetratricopeptide (TPR) repeat protein
LAVSEEAVVPPPAAVPKGAPRVFLSYSWAEGETHKAWVLALAVRLRTLGIDARLDRFRLSLGKPGESLPQFMEREIREAYRVVTVLTPQYARLADDRDGGVGYEHDIFTGFMLAGEKERFVHIIRSGSFHVKDRDCAVPTAFLGRACIDFRDDARFDQCVQELASVVSGKVQVPSPQRLDDTLVGVPDRVESSLPQRRAQFGGIQIFVETAVIERITSLGDAVVAGTSRGLEDAKKRWREGKRQAVVEWLQRFEDSPGLLQALPDVLAAQVLRFQASVLLDEALGLDKAERLLDASRERDPNADCLRERAVLAWRRSGAEAALAVLDEAPQQNQPERNLRAGLLLSMGRGADALEILGEAQLSGTSSSSSPEDVTAASAEASRLRAMARFSQGELESAVAEANRAFAGAPAWKSIRYLVGVLRYCLGLTRPARPSTIPAWPQPVDPLLVRRDAAGQAALTEALAIFARLLEDAAEAERRRVECWLLACLANLSGREIDASQYAAAVLEVDPANPYVAAWVGYRDMSVDLTRSMNALRVAAVDQGSPEETLTLASLYMDSGRPGDAVELLEQAKLHFEQSDEIETWRYWRANAALASGDHEFAQELAEDLPDRPRRAVRLAALRLRGDQKALLKYLEECTRDTRDPLYLLAACRFQATAGQWEYVADRAATLIEGVGSLESHRLAAAAFTKTGQFEKCVEALNPVLAAPGNDGYRDSLLRMRAQALARLGRISEALADLREVASDSTEDLLSVAQLHALQGDLHALATVASALRDRADLSSEAALGIAELLLHSDREMAKAFWRIGLRRDPPDDSVGRALALGMQLGLDDETASLTARLAALAAQGRGGVRAFSVDELLKEGKRWQSHQDALFKKYERGEIPIHLLATAANRSLATFYHSAPAWAEVNGPKGFALRARHGGRPVPDDSVTIGRGSLAMDVTALLMGEHLELLDEVEAAFAPILVPFGIAQFFFEELERLSPHQPSRIEADRQVLEAQRNSLIRERQEVARKLDSDEARTAGTWATWLALLELSKRSDSFVLDLPLDDEHPHGRPVAVAGPERLGRLINPRAIVDALVRDGVLTEERTASILERLGTTGARGAVASTVPPAGSRIYALETALEALADASILGLAAHHFQIIVEAQEQEDRRSRLAAWESIQQEHQWVDRLFHRVTAGLTRGSYRQLPASGGGAGGEMPPTTIRLLSSLIPSSDNLFRVVWVDDRYLNQFSSFGPARVVDVIDVLSCLTDLGRLSETKYFDALLKLRSGNVRYLPPTVAELARIVAAAPQHGPHLVESSALAAFRRSVSASLADRDSIQIPEAISGAPRQLGEIPYLLAVNRAGADAITEVWRRARATGGDADQAQQAARRQGKWIVENMLWDLGLLRATVLNPGSEPDPGISAAGLAGLVLSTIQMLDQPRRESPAPSDDWAKSYADWIFRTVLRPRFDSSETLRGDVIRTVCHFLQEGGTDAQETEQLRAVRRVIAGRVYDALPEDLRSGFTDPEFLSFSGRQIQEVFGDERYQFAADSFVAAVGDALAGKQSKIADVNGHEVIIEPAHPPNVFQVTDQSGQSKGADDPAFLLLGSDPAGHAEALHRLATDLDLPPQRLSVLGDRIAAESDPRLRLRLLQERQSESLVRRYRVLENELRSTGKFDVDAIRPPSHLSVFAHLRLPGTLDHSQFNAALDRSAKELIEEIGLEEAFLRLAGLPVPLPRAFLDHLETTDEVALRGIVKRRLSRAYSPIYQIQALRALAAVAHVDRRYLRLLRRGLRSFAASRFDAEVRLLRQLLVYSLTLLRESSDQDGTSLDSLISVWYHSHRVASAFIRAGADVTALERMLSERRPTNWTYFFTAHQRDQNDIAHPEWLRTDRLALASIYYVLSNAPSDTLTEELADLFASRLSVGANGHQLPAHDLLLDTSLLGDLLGSFLGTDKALQGPSEATIARRIFSALSSKRDLVEEALGALEKNLNAAGPWLTLQMVSGGQPLEEPLRGRLLAIIRSPDLLKAFASLGPYAPLAVLFVVRTVIATGDPRDRGVVAAQLPELARDVLMTQSVGQGAHSTSKDIGTSLLDAAYLLSTAEDSAQSAARSFARLMESLGVANPALWSSIRAIVEQLVSHLDLGTSRWFAPLRLKAQAAAPFVPPDPH